MFDFYEKRKLRNLLFTRVTAGILLVAAGLLFWSAYGRFTAEQETREKRAESFTELNRLKERAAALESKVERMESERGMEEEIREQFDVAKEGEQVVVIVDEHDDRNASSEPKIYPLPPEPTLLERLKFW